jgi:hypothetical protein
MRADNSTFLLAAQQRRHDELVDRVKAALRTLDRQGAAITFPAVARAAGVSRAFLYKTPALATEIQRLRATQAGRRSRIPASQRRGDSSKDALIKRLTAENRHLREELQQMRDQNAILLGRLREAKH